MTPEEENALLRQHVGLVHVRSSSDRTETRCVAHLLPRHHQILLDRLEQLLDELHAAKEAARKQAAEAKAEVQRLQDVVEGLAACIAVQSALLSRRAETPAGGAL